MRGSAYGHAGRLDCGRWVLSLATNRRGGREGGGSSYGVSDKCRKADVQTHHEAPQRTELSRDGVTRTVIVLAGLKTEQKENEGSRKAISHHQTEECYKVGLSHLDARYEQSPRHRTRHPQPLHRPSLPSASTRPSSLTSPHRTASHRAPSPIVGYQSSAHSIPRSLDTRQVNSIRPSPAADRRPTTKRERKREGKGATQPRVAPQPRWGPSETAPRRR